MKLLSFRINNQNTFGYLQEDGVVDLGKHFTDITDLRDALRQDRLAELTAFSSSADYALTDIEFLPTIPNAEKIICIGVNYAKRNAEYKDGSEAPKYPSVFMRTRESLVGHQQALLDPPESDQLDYEGEIVLVIGKAGRRIPEAHAHEYVAGMTIMNEGSLRDYLRHAKFNVTQGKNFAKSGSLGPWMVTPNETDPFSELHITTHVNGELRQQDTTDNLMFPFRYLIHYLSTFYHLKPGDIIATGTPNGAGARFDPPRYLKPDDSVEIAVSGIGTLSNTVEKEHV